MSLKLNTIADVTVTTAGTRVQVTSSFIQATTVVIQAKRANTGKIYVGDSSVSSTRGLQLEPGESVSISIDPSGIRGPDELIMSDLYLDSSVSGEGAKVSYIARRA